MDMQLYLQITASLFWNSDSDDTSDEEDMDTSRSLVEVCSVCSEPDKLTDGPHDWFGCDNCGRWYHYNCLPSILKCDVDLSVLTNCAWQCMHCT